MTRQTAAPLPHYSLNVSNRFARDVARMAPRIDLDAPYQRGSVWTDDQRVALVKSWIMGVPVPAVIINDRSNDDWKAHTRIDVYETDDPIWAVVDGKQRIETAVAWFAGSLYVPASWFPPEDVAKTFDFPDGPHVSYDTLSERGQRFMELGRSSLPVVETKLATIEAEAELYLLLNGGGTGHTAADMARAAEVAGGKP